MIADEAYKIRQNNAQVVCLETMYSKKLITNRLKYATTALELINNRTGHAGSVILENKSKVVLNVILKFLRLKLSVRSVLNNKDYKSSARIKMNFPVLNVDIKRFLIKALVNVWTE